ncbi:hypothetical protein N7453_009183 [Penicillium expansum]|nr:hypothetical protein N7453_009183 [Penicillium expansum]
MVQQDPPPRWHSLGNGRPRHIHAQRCRHHEYHPVDATPRPARRESRLRNEGIAKPSTAMVADNTTDLPRSTRDVGESGDVISGTGNSMSAGVEAKHAYMGPNHHAGHGDTRDFKRSKYGRSVIERYQEE